jgi:U3 small nucleolar RNA-associated protein 25
MSLGSDVIWQTDNPYFNIEISPENFDYLSIEEHLRVRWGDTHGGFRCFASKRQRALYTLLVTYSNIFYPLITYQTFPYEIHEITDVCLLHILNHCSKSRKNIKENTITTTLKNNKCLKGDIPKDRGFVQAKVLIIVPMKNRAWALVNRLVQLAIKENYSNFVQRREIFEQEIGTHEMQHDNNKERKYPNTHIGHPPIFEGNTDDNFGFGIAIKKGSIHLYKDISKSDILFFTPLAIAGKAEESVKLKGHGLLDFLSSIEILFVDNAETITNQNWENLITSFEVVNQIPECIDRMNIMRVYDRHMLGLANQFRQTIMLSNFPTIEMYALMSRFGLNHNGNWRLKLKKNSILETLNSTGPQVFKKFHITSLASAADERYVYFKTNIWPQIIKEAPNGYLIVVASFLDMDRLAKFLEEQNIAFTKISEYSKRCNDVRSKTLFYDGRKNILLYSERAHFYKRHTICGIKNVFFYSLPQQTKFYLELMNQVMKKDIFSTSLSHIYLFSNFDSLSLERIVGSSRAKQMLTTTASSFVFTHAH